ncbi:conserved hypothetical protein [Hahella chejuensis KCTC 2396]|uniref:Uncharacterized protein n=1 Tax=Hahella chejuensis (strain KCTC 2396) TaxID=349521 RepID=Q2SNA2_HAHCH|nr:hypothetical protein [Hahella chejuensis]ABC27872.1 conserved hypothetical protein [Hahella chejuensis KCTC 2396]
MNKGKDRWLEEQKAVRATQLAFDVSKEVQQVLKRAALEQDLNPPDMIRKILGLSYNKTPIRPRLTVSLRAEDFTLLAQKYDIDPEDTLAIREKAAEELIAFAQSLLE